MKKYEMIMFSVLMSIFLILPLTLQAGEGKKHDKMMGDKEYMGKMHHDWLSHLNLDEEVIQKMQEMRLKNKERMLELKNQIERKELEMEKVLMNKKLDFNKILSINDEISDLRQKISRERLENKIEMYKLLPDDKKEKAREMFLHRFKRRP